MNSNNFVIHANTAEYTNHVFVIHANKAEYATSAYFKNRRHIASMLELWEIASLGSTIE
jgi:CHASE2 domain-containing sensor protein